MDNTMKKIVIDFDSTLFDFMGLWLERIKEAHNLDIDPSTVTSYHHLTEAYPDHDFSLLYKTDDFYTGQESRVYADAKDFVRAVKGLPFVEEVVIMSTGYADPEHPNYIHKKEFIESLFGDIVDSVEIVGYDKWEHTGGAVLIDDNLDVVLKHCLNGDFGICYTRDGAYAWNTDALQYALKNSISRVGLNYAQILQILKVTAKARGLATDKSYAEVKGATVDYKDREPEQEPEQEVVAEPEQEVVAEVVVEVVAEPEQDAPLKSTPKRRGAKTKTRRN